MKTIKGFILMTKDELRGWLASAVVDRTVREIQNHHTYLPDYSSFRRSPDPVKWLDTMKQYHVVNNGWADIAQNITTFPDGTLAICRPLNKPPAGITGHNAQGICIEHLGNFDQGRDVLTPEHTDTIVHLNAALAERFNLKVDTAHIVYHHWFHSKTCPGTAFFGGNTREDATARFLPLVQAELDRLTGKTPKTAGVDKPALGQRLVTASVLNVRSGPGTGHPKTGTVFAGNILGAYEENQGWVKISGSESRWVAARYLIPVVKGRVLADTLNIRTGPGTDYPVIDKLVKGADVLIFETDNGWCRVDPNEKWVSAKYIEKQEI